MDGAKGSEPACNEMYKPATPGESIEPPRIAE
jgi:hypothetical protein